MGQSMMRWVLCLTLLWAFSLPSFGQERWQLLILGEANTKLAPDHPAYRRIEQALLSELGASDIDAFHPALVGVDLGCATVACPGLEEPELIERARSASRPIDMLVLFSVNVRQQESPIGTKYRVDIPVRVLNLENGQHFFNRDLAFGDFKLPPMNPAEAAFADWIASLASDAAINAAVPIADAITNQRRRFLFWIDLERIPSGEVNDIYRGLEALEGSVRGGVTLIEEGQVEQQLLHKLTNVSYSLRSELDGGALRLRITDLIDDLGVSADISYDRGGRRLQIVHSGIAYLSYYVAAVLLLLGLLMAATIYEVQRRVELRLGKYTAQRRAGAGLAMLAAVPAFVPRKAHWHEQQLAWETDLTRARQLTDEARSALEKGQASDAVKSLESALKVNADDEGAATLLNEAAARVQIDALLDQVEAVLETDPSEALHILERASAMTDRPLPRQASLTEQATRNFRSNFISNRLADAARAQSSGNPYAALALYDALLDDLRGLAEFVNDRAEINRSRESLANELPAISQTFSGGGLLEGMDFILEPVVQVGRSSGPVAGTIGMGFKRLSRVGKQVSIERRGIDYRVNHYESSNGTYLDDNRLLDGSSTTLGPQSVLAMGGQTNPARKGSCQLVITLPASGLGSAVISLDNGPIALLPKDELAKTWSTVQYDSAKTWVMLGQRLYVGLSPTGEPLLNVAKEQAAFELGVVGGRLELGPAGESEVRINDVPCKAAVPVSAGVKIAVAGRLVSFQPYRDEQELTF